MGGGREGGGGGGGRKAKGVEYSRNSGLEVLLVKINFFTCAFMFQCFSVFPLFLLVLSCFNASLFFHSITCVQ